MEELALNTLIKWFKMTAPEKRMLLILDLDETLIYAIEKSLEREAGFRVGPYYVYRRPHLNEFLLSCLDDFQIAVWSSSGACYLASVVKAIFPKQVAPAFVWGRERCVHRYDPECLDMYFVKDLKKVKRLGYSLDTVLIVDDTPQKTERNFGNAIYISPFYADASDSELQKLAAYLKSLAQVPNVRSIEKRGWKTRLQSSP